MATYEGPDPHKQSKPIFLNDGSKKKPFGFVGDQKMFSDFLRDVGKNLGDGGKNHSINQMRAYRNRIKMGFVPKGLEKLPSGPVGINPRPPLKPGQSPNRFPPPVTNEWQLLGKPQTGRYYGNSPGMIHLDSKSQRRAEMFRQASAKNAKLYDTFWSAQHGHPSSAEGRFHLSTQYDAAAQMHTDTRLPQVKPRVGMGFSSQQLARRTEDSWKHYLPRVTDDQRQAVHESRGTHFDSDRGKNTMPYRHAVRAKSRPIVPRPSSGVAPRIAGSLASKMLGSTGALGLLPGIIYLARGGTIGGMAGPLPPSIKKPSRINGQW